MKDLEWIKEASTDHYDVYCIPPSSNQIGRKAIVITKDTDYFTNQEHKIFPITVTMQCQMVNTFIDCLKREAESYYKLHQRILNQQ